MNNSTDDIELRPSPVFTLFKTMPLILCAAGLTWLANCCFPLLIWPGIFFMLYAVHRYLFIRRVIYLVTPQYIRVTKGIFFKRTDTVELFRVRDYVVTEPLLLRVFKLMDVQLSTGDQNYPVLWLRGIPRSGLIDIIRARVLENRRRYHVFEIS